MTHTFLAICLTLASFCTVRSQTVYRTGQQVFQDTAALAPTQTNTAPVTDIPVKPHWIHALPELAKTYRTELKYGGLPLLVAGGWVTTYASVDAQLQEEAQESRRPGIDAVADHLEPLGRGVSVIPGFSGMLAYGLIAKDQKARKAGIVGLSAFFINANVTHQLKQFFNRHRPNSYASYDTWGGPENASGNHHSFPSSHTSTAFSAATVIATVYRDKPVVPIAAYTLATMVGASRIYQNHHWASDVLAGALVGYLTAKGTLAAYDFVDRKLQRRKQHRRLLVLPQVSGHGIGLTATVAL